MEITKNIIEKYLQGRCTPQEVSAVELYLKNNPEIIDSIFTKEDWNSEHLDLPYPKEKFLFDKTTTKIKSKTKRAKIIVINAIAAAILLITFFSLLLTKSKEVSLDQQIIANNTPIDTTNIPNLYYINSGKNDMIIPLSDGSAITLFPASEVRFAETFEFHNERKISLKGKAIFKVAKNKLKPFKVYTNGIITTALGTEFIVEELQNQETKINLIEGLIEISTAKASSKQIKRIIKPNEFLKINYNLSLITEEVKINNSKKYREGYYYQNTKIIDIKNSSLQDVINNLEQNFDITLQYDPINIKDKYYSGSFPIRSSVCNDIITEINYLHNVNILEIQKPN